MTTDNSEEFTVSCRGSITGTQYAGKFRAKRFLSHRDHVLQDRIRREALGEGAPGALAAATADMLSQLQVRIISAPSFWKDGGNGWDLTDEEPVIEAYQKAIEIQKRALDAIQKEAEADEKVLREEE